MAALLWDQHTCLPLQTDTDVDVLTCYRRAGGALVSVNAGYRPHSFDDTMAGHLRRRGWRTTEIAASK